MTRNESGCGDDAAAVIGGKPHFHRSNLPRRHPSSAHPAGQVTRAVFSRESVETMGSLLQTMEQRSVAMLMEECTAGCDVAHVTSTLGMVMIARLVYNSVSPLLLDAVTEVSSRSTDEAIEEAFTDISETIVDLAATGSTYELSRTYDADDLTATIRVTRSILRGEDIPPEDRAWFGVFDDVDVYPPASAGIPTYTGTGADSDDDDALVAGGRAAAAADVNTILAALATTLTTTLVLAVFGPVPL